MMSSKFIILPSYKFFLLHFFKGQGMKVRYAAGWCVWRSWTVENWPMNLR